MRVLYDHNAFTRQEVGGITRYAATLAAEVDRSTSANVLVAAPLHFNKHLHSIDVRIKYGMYVRNFKGAGRLLPFVNEFGFKRIISRYRPDIIHETHYSKRDYSSLTNAPIVYTVHDLIPELFPQDFVHYQSFINARAKIFRSDSFFVCISNHTRRDLQRLFGVLDDRIAVIHHGGPPVVQRDTTSGAQRSVLYVGNRKGYKNFRCLVKALGQKRELLENVKLITFGGGQFSPEELADFDSVGLKYYENLAGDDVALANAYRNCSIFVCPSFYEGFGLTLIEAMASGAPVVCARASCLPEIASFAAEYFDPGRPEELADVLYRLIGDQDKLDYLTSLGYERASEFTWKRSALEHLAFYQKAVDTRHG